MEETREIVMLIQSLGDNATTAFIWWLIKDAVYDGAVCVVLLYLVGKLIKLAERAIDNELL